jgi:TonB family protein
MSPTAGAECVLSPNLAQALKQRRKSIAARFFAFTAASLALHALTLGAYAPGSGSAPARAEAFPVVHAVLAPGAPAVTPAHDSPSESQADGPATFDNRASGTLPSEQNATVAKAEPPAGARGLDIPLPDKWYTAAEVDVRAEPRNPPRLDYPQELAMSGLSAIVKLRIFIDERGTVRKVELAEPGPDRAFDLVAQRAWDDVRFSPALKQGVPVKSQKLLELDFTPDLVPRR